MAQRCECPAGIPEWFITFADMMSLLLAFFILLVSMSDTQSEHRVTAMMESLREQFGYDMSQTASTPGFHRPMNQKMADVASLGRSKRQNLEEGGSNSVRSPVGEYARVRSLNPAGADRKGGVITFEGASPQLSRQEKEQLAEIVPQIRGLPQVVEVRGHAMAAADDGGDTTVDAWDLAYQRARVVMEALVAEGIEPQRFRLEVAGPNEPAHVSDDLELLKRNARVEVYLRQQLADETRGTREEREKRKTSGFTQDAN